MVEINVPFTETERKEITDVRAIDVGKRLKWDKKVEAYGRKLAEQKKPFCSHCAMRAHKTWKQQVQLANTAAVQSGKRPTPRGEFNADLSQFEKGMRFVSESVINDKKIINGTPTFVPVYFRNYSCDLCTVGRLSIECDTSVGSKK